MDGSRPYVDVAWQGSAFHTINLWMREDGMRVDKVLLTADPNYIP